MVVDGTGGSRPGGAEPSVVQAGIHVDGLTKTLGGTTILDGLCFDAPEGRITGLLGPNGAGKTTTMRVLSTLLSVDEGTATVGGVDVAADPLGARRVIGLVTEEPGLFERLTPREHLRLVAEVHGMTRANADASIDQVADRLGLGPFVDQRVNELSKGNRQKVSLARALVHRPRVLLLDEPTANLDVVAADGLHRLLEEAVADGEGGLLGRTTVLLSSHVIEEVDRLAHHVVGIAEGRTVAQGTTEELTAQLGAPDFRSAIVSLLGGAVLGG